jgi:hypothetical protein
MSSYIASYIGAMHGWKKSDRAPYPLSATNEMYPSSSVQPGSTPTMLHTIQVPPPASPPPPATPALGQAPSAGISQHNPSRRPPPLVPSARRAPSRERTPAATAASLPRPPLNPTAAHRPLPYGRRVSRPGHGSVTVADCFGPTSAVRILDSSASRGLAALLAAEVFNRHSLVDTAHGRCGGGDSNTVGPPPAYHSIIRAPSFSLHCQATWPHSDPASLLSVPVHLFGRTDS